MNGFQCENGDCDTVFPDDADGNFDDEWIQADKERIINEKELNKSLFVYCNNCKLRDGDKVEFVYGKFRFISIKS
jgi:hypothetical protein